MYRGRSGMAAGRADRAIHACIHAMLLLGSLAAAEAAAAASGDAYDVLVYGATASGCMAAVAAAREGARVALVHYGSHVGGMPASGLGETDKANATVIGGLASEFFTRVGAAYGLPAGTRAWAFEPHVAEGVFEAMLAAEAPSLTLVRNAQFASLSLSAGRVTAITDAGGRSYAASVFVDASYTGDLLVAVPGVTLTYGRAAGICIRVRGGRVHI